jgi:hypothetical protein
MILLYRNVLVTHLLQFVVAYKNSFKRSFSIEKKMKIFFLGYHVSVKGSKLVKHQKDCTLIVRDNTGSQRKFSTFWMDSCYSCCYSATYKCMTTLNYSHTFGTRFWLPNVNIPPCKPEELLDFVQIWHKLVGFTLKCLCKSMPKVCEYLKVVILLRIVL